MTAASVREAASKPSEILLKALNAPVSLTRSLRGDAEIYGNSRRSSTERLRRRIAERSARALGPELSGKGLPVVTGHVP